MTNKESKAVKEVEAVLAVLTEYLNKEKDVPYSVVQSVVKNLHEIEEDYDKTINDLLLSNSLVVKMETMFDLIGTIGTLSVENEEKLDCTLKILDNHLNSIKDD